MLRLLELHHSPTSFISKYLPGDLWVFRYWSHLCVQTHMEGWFLSTKSLLERLFLINGADFGVPNLLDHYFSACIWIPCWGSKYGSLKVVAILLAYQLPLNTKTNKKIYKTYKESTTFKDLWFQIIWITTKDYQNG